MTRASPLSMLLYYENVLLLDMKLSLLLSLALTFTLHAAEKIIIKGSDTLGAKMVPILAKKYQETHPELNFEIAAEGSSICFTCLLDNTCDIGIASRKVKESEHKHITDRGLTLVEHIVAYDMLAIVVDEKNPLTNLSKSDIKNIFTSQITHWEEVGWNTEMPIKPLIRNTSSGTHKAFRKIAMDKEPYGRTTKKVAVNHEYLQMLDKLKTDNGIGYCGLAFMGKGGLKPLKIDGISPCADNVKTYPFTRPLYFYTTENTSKEALAFIEWVKTSKEAAKVIEKVGFVAVLSNFHSSD